MESIGVFKLSSEQREELLRLTNTLPPEDLVHKRALILIELDAGKSKKAIAKEFGFSSAKSVTDILKKYQEKGIIGIHTNPNLVDILKTFLKENPLDNGNKWTVNSLLPKIGGSKSSLYKAVNELINNDKKYLDFIEYHINLKKSSELLDTTNYLDFNSIPNNTALLSFTLKNEDGNVVNLSFDLKDIFSKGNAQPTNILEYQEQISIAELILKKILNNCGLLILNEFSNSLFTSSNEEKKKSIQIEYLYGRFSHKIPSSVAEGVGPNKRIWSFELLNIALGTVEKTSFRKSSWILNTVLGRSKGQYLSPTTLCQKKTEFGMMCKEKINQLSNDQIPNLKINQDGKIELICSIDQELKTDNIDSEMINIELSPSNDIKNDILNNIQDIDTSNSETKDQICEPLSANNIPFNNVNQQNPQRSVLTSKENIDDIINEYNFEKPDDEQIRKDIDLSKIELDPNDTCYMAGDICYVPHQKESRNVNGKNGMKTLEYVPNAVGTLHHGLRMSKEDRKEQKINDIAYFCNSSLITLFFVMLATLIFNKLIDKQIVFFYDGEQQIKDLFLKLFSWKRNIILILDWFHITQIVNQYISIALSNDKKYKDQKIEVKRKALRLLWAGNVYGCIDFLENIDPKLIKNDKKLIDLINYLLEREEYIVCYEIRKKLGLPNSSNPAETAANILVAMRQKKKGSSWSFNGSLAMSIISMLIKNGMLKNFIKHCYSLVRLPIKLAS